MTELVQAAIDQVPHVYLPYQQSWVGDPARVRLIEKSRRIGISWATAGDMTLTAATKSGCDGWYIGYNKDMAQEFIRDCAYWARIFNEAVSGIEESVFEDDDENKQILMFVIRFASGWRITALSSRPTNLRNKRGHIVIDEAAFHDDLPGLIKAAMAVIMWGGRNRVDIISTHNGVENYFNTLVEETKAGKRNFSLHRHTLEDALRDGLFKRICLVNSWVWTPELEAAWVKDLRQQYGDDADEELDCVPSRSGGTYLHRQLLERAMVPAPVVRLELKDEFVTWDESARIGFVEQWCDTELRGLLEQLPQDKLHFFGEDFGRTSDRTCICPGYLAQDLTRIYPFVLEMLNVPFEQQKQVAFYLIDRLPRRIGGALDATGNGAYLAEACALRYNGAKDEDRESPPHIQEVKLTAQWYAENLPPLKAAFEDDLMQIPRDADHLIDLSAFKVVNGLPKLPDAKNKSVSDPTSRPRHGDVAIAYVLAHFASRLPVIEYSGHQAAPKAPSSKHDRALRASAGGFKATRGGIL